ncbi:MAG TPA: TAT-variant-translocated molybdopterin oxidoreductase [Tepidisphaeraceae bacterium]|jgi:molybdopterin-containing oxidoreductase family iron-sulfur binding subunit|nr:TAT-variant-translocated molybdopterin oxidoreductase [Tepidisphaeraceae bacterium]
MKHHSAQREYWRSLEHLANTPEIQQSASAEFASYEPDGMLSMSSLTRRRFMKLMGASMALAGLSLNGCRRWPEAKLAPYTSTPPNRIPGIPEQYATMMELGGVGSPLLVTSYDGRPIKIEGNPTHPFSETVKGRSGAADAIAQASILEMYDPDRSKAVINRSGGNEIATDWDHFTSAMSSTIDSLTASPGSGLAILCEATASLTTTRLKAALAKRFPTAFYEYEALSRDNERVGIKSALGQPARQVLHLDKAAVVVLLDADPLGAHPAHVRYAGDWVKHRPNKEKETSRVYAIESAMTISGSVADCRMGVRPSRVGAILSAIAAQVGLAAAAASLTAEEEAFIKPLIADLSANSGKSLVAVGPHHPAEMHAMALAINDKIGAIGSTLTLLEEPNADRPHHFDSLADLTKKLKAKQIDTLVILGGNPAYDAPTDLDFAGALKNAKTSIHLSLYDNETSHACTWHVPRAHYLEAWGDARAWDGTVSICQPLIEPLYNGKSSDQMLAFFAGEPETESDAIVRKTFADIDDLAWRRVLNDGLVKDSGFKKVSATINSSAALPAAGGQSGYEVRFLQDSKLYDGRFATSGWLQELPDPLSKIVWDNAVLVSPRDAAGLGVGVGDMLKVTVGGASVEMPAFVLPGQPVGVIGLALGYGRTMGEHIGSDVGVNTYALRTTGAMYFTSAQVTATGAYYDLATTQDHHLFDQLGIQERQARVGEKHKSAEIIREATAAEYKRDPQLFQRNEEGGISLQLYEPPRRFNDPHAWGMAIDLSRCIGCHACVIACQAENNVPIVGRDNVLKSRQMHWIRIDRYFKGDAEDPNPEVVFQPVACQQCENAPCEEVCPVGATTHDTEGLNVMVYNRCVGTRYCSNNCPYKVRRFNYLDWHSQDPRHDKYPKPWLGLPDTQQIETVPMVERMMYNPEVTVRMRGVMEKCTFCIQRIHNTTIAKRARGEELKDGEIMTACQQSCPTQAIVFGDLNDANSKVSKWHQDKRAYSLLDADLNTKPRNRYLAKISNPNDEANG